MDCPICKTALVKKYNECGVWGTEESLYECPDCKLYAEQFAYGNTEICIGDFITGYTYSISSEAKTALFEKINKLAELYATERSVDNA